MKTGIITVIMFVLIVLGLDAYNQYTNRPWVIARAHRYNARMAIYNDFCKASPSQLAPGQKSAIGTRLIQFGGAGFNTVFEKQAHLTGPHESLSEYLNLAYDPTNGVLTGIPYAKVQWEVSHSTWTLLNTP